MNANRRFLGWILSLTLLLPGTTAFAGAAPDEVELPQANASYYVVGRFQQEGSVASASQPLEGQVVVSVDATRLIDVEGYDPADLAVCMELRATRHDGVTGPDSLKYLRNGRVYLADSTGKRVLEAPSPVQQGVAAADRIAGEWMPVTVSLASMTATNGRLATLSLFDYNDFPKQNPPVNTGMTVEVRNARVVDTSRDAEGNAVPRYAVTTFNGFDGTYAYNGGNLWYADWKYADIYPVDLSDDPGRYRLQGRITFTSSDPSVDVSDCFEQLTVKLRSTEDNGENNSGWDLKPGDFQWDNGSAALSIDLDRAPTNSKGHFDFKRVERIIAIGTVAGQYRDRIGSITMTLSGMRIVDAQAVETARAALRALIETPVADALNDADRAVYDAALTMARATAEDPAALAADLQNAIGVLRQTMPASDAQKAQLDDWMSRSTDWNTITASSRDAYLAAVAAAGPVREGGSRCSVERTLQAIKDAWYALEFDDSVPDGDPGNVDGEGGVTAADALMALQAATGKITLTDQQSIAADVDGKDGVTAADALLILQYATGKITSFPVGKEDLSMAITAVENEHPLTVCNPIDISYMFQRAKNDQNRPDGQATYRESADPAIVVFQNRYWLFASHGDGYWVSDDLADWRFIPVDLQKQPEFARYAPATCVIGDTLYLTHSEGGHMLKTQTPADPDSWVDIGKPDNWMDPGMFYNDPADGGDGYVYLYHGLSHQSPIRVVKLDPNDNMKKVDGPYDCCWPDKVNRGFEVAGDTNTNYDANDTQEGAWPVKWGGRYYLTCAVPGTQYATYSDNCYVSDDPMGPFVLCENSPVSWKATGFAQGAGHGGVFEDLGGHWWKVDTCRIAGFERRLVLYPATFDEDGSLYTNTVNGDLPMFIPTQNDDPFGDPGPGWTMIAYGKQATASSNEGAAALAFNEDMASAWVAATGDEGEWLQVDLGRVYPVHAAQINFADKNVTGEGGRGHGYAYRYLMEFSQDGERWYTMIDRTAQTDDRSHEYVEFADTIGARYVRITNKGEVPAGGRFAVSGLRIFGEGSGKKPAPVVPQTVQFERREDNNRTAAIAWGAVPGAQGYVIRCGTAPDKLYTHYQVWGVTDKTVNSLIRGVDYYFTVDAFNESGVTPGTAVFSLPATEERQPYDPDGSNPALVNRAAGLAVHEAENAAFGGEGVAPRYEVRASNNAALHGFGKAGSYVEFTGVDGGDGDATLRISYAARAAARVTVVVNGTPAGIKSLPKTSGWATFATTDVPLTGLTAGETNTLRLEGTGDLIHPDWVQLVYDTGYIDPPGDPTPADAGAPFEGLKDPVKAPGFPVYEAEDGQIAAAVIAADAQASGGKSVHNMEREGAYVAFANVDAGQGGAARLRLCYCEGNGSGDLRVVVNGVTAVTATLPNTGTWSQFQMIEFSLKDLLPGAANTVRLECGGHGYNPDWIQILY